MGAMKELDLTLREAGLVPIPRELAEALIFDLRHVIEVRLITNPEPVAMEHWPAARELLVALLDWLNGDGDLGDSKPGDPYLVAVLDLLVCDLEDMRRRGTPVGSQLIRRANAIADFARRSG